MGIGINALRLTVLDVFAWAAANTPGVDGIWTDESFSTSRPLVAARAVDARSEAFPTTTTETRGRRLLYFGGVGFKYCEPIHREQDHEDPSEACLLALTEAALAATAFVDVVITS